MRIQKFCALFLTNFSIDLDEIQCVVTTCWFVEISAKCFSRDQYSRERTVLIRVFEIYLWHRPATEHLQTSLFQTWHDAISNLAL